MSRKPFYSEVPPCGCCAKSSRVQKDGSFYICSYCFETLIKVDELKVNHNTFQNCVLVPEAFLSKSNKATHEHVLPEVVFDGKSFIDKELLLKGVYLVFFLSVSLFLYLS
jgi:hypothetical protein